MKTINDLDLKVKDKAKVQMWLMQIMKHFERMSDGDRETVERYDLDNLDFFYFTDCRDVLSKNPESKGVEDAETIKKRKKAVEYKLLFKYLLGKELGRKRPCSHCGNEDRFINSLGDGTGHYLFCPKCGMTTIVTYPIGYQTCIQRIIDNLKKHGYNAFDFLPESMQKAIKEQEKNEEETYIKEMQEAYKNYHNTTTKEEKHKCCGKCRDKKV